MVGRSVFVLFYATLIYGLAFQIYTATQIPNDALAEQHESGQTWELVNIVESDDGATVPGLLASLRSIITNCPSPWRLRIYILTLPSTHAYVRRSVECLMHRVSHPRNNQSLGTNVYGYRVLTFDIKRFQPEWKIVYRERKNMPNMSTPLNFARMYLHRFLRDVHQGDVNTPEKVISLDSDTIVQQDITVLYDNTLVNNTKVVGLAYRKLPLRKYHVDFRHPYLTHWREMFLEGGKINTASPAYNNGVVVQHLRRWEQQDITKRIERLLDANKHRQLYRFGYNAPMLLGVHGSVEEVSWVWNLDGIGLKRRRKEDIEKACILHWTGPNKPWKARFDKPHRRLWEPYNCNACVGGPYRRRI
eukprot:gb/GECG01015527.1/.p1 GENE.gb/GECG01015527.1/~~gb/GECG01015527.1/.p1  ORF type:complete len:360 (+),score=24.32 gb/GECG01015527.1/:1-1080(+)